MGKPSFDAVHEMDDDPDFYKAALGICCAIPSAETLRQRFDLIGSGTSSYPGHRGQCVVEQYGLHRPGSHHLVPKRKPALSVVICGKKKNTKFWTCPCKTEQL